MSPDRPSYPTRREVIALGIGAFIVAVVPLGSGAARDWCAAPFR